MPQRTKIFLALPEQDAISDALTNALADAKNPRLAGCELTHDICQAEILISDTQTIEFDFTELPQRVAYIQLIDCGSGAPHSTDENLTIANPSSLLAPNAAKLAIQQWQSSVGHLQDQSEISAGIIGFGMLGYEIAKSLNQIATKIWISDIRTPRQESLHEVGARRSSLDMLLSTCDTIFVAIHPGPTSNPLLSRRELRLPSVNTTIVNLSNPQVIDIQAIENLNTNYNRNIIYLEPDINPADSTRNQSAKSLTDYILDNVKRYAQNQQPRSIVEPVTFPKAGDPAFWASKMHPRQTPI